MVLRIGRLGGVDLQIESVWGGVLDAVGRDREVCAVYSLLSEFGVADEDSGTPSVSALGLQRLKWC